MYQDRIRWGFEEFPVQAPLGGLLQFCPASAHCCAGTDVLVKPALMNAMPINAAMADNSGTRTATPTHAALKMVLAFYRGFMDGVKERYVLLSTDGAPNCQGVSNACGETESVVTMLRSDGVQTIVLGIDADASTAAACLNRLALAGGVPRPGGPPHYYAADDPAALEMYLKEIIGGLAKPSCFVDLTMAPPDPSKVAVFLDGKQIPWDPARMNGWHYDPANPLRIVIYGSHCKAVQSHSVKDIGVQFGCPPCTGTAGCAPP